MARRAGDENGMLPDDAAEARRQALRRFMEQHGLNPNALARKAHITPSAIYNFLGGTSKSLSQEALERIAGVVGAPVDELMRGGATTGGHVGVTHTLGIGGRMFELAHDEQRWVERPAGVPTSVPLSAAMIAGDALRPFPGQWALFVEQEPADPEDVIGQLAIVRLAGRRDLFLREVIHGSRRGLYTLLFFAAAPMIDVELAEVRRVVGMTQNPDYRGAP